MSDVAQFVVYKLHREGGQTYMQHIASLQAHQEDDLLDFGVVQDELWALWLNTQLETKITYSSFQK